MLPTRGAANTRRSRHAVQPRAPVVHAAVGCQQASAHGCGIPAGTSTWLWDTSRHQHMAVGYQQASAHGCGIPAGTSTWLWDTSRHQHMAVGYQQAPAQLKPASQWHVLGCQQTSTNFKPLLVDGIHACGCTRALACVHTRTLRCRSVPLVSRSEQASVLGTSSLHFMHGLACRPLA